MDRLETQIDRLTTDMNTRFAEARAETDVRFDGVEQALISLQTQINSLQRELRDGFAEMGRHMRVLHEDVIDRIAKIRG